MNYSLVKISDHGLLGSNFYWNKYESKGLSKEDVLATGLTGDCVEVHKDIIDVLKGVDKEIQDVLGFRLFIKEGYRSKSLYEIIYKRRCEKFGKEETDKIFNMNDMPHSTGLSVDVALFDPAENKEVYMRNGDDGTDALFVGFYKDKEDEESKRYHKLQVTLIEVMQNNGFRLGTKREYFHFDYRPNLPKNY